MKSYHTNEIGTPKKVDAVNVVIDEAVANGKQIITSAPKSERKRVAAKFFIDLIDKLINVVEEEIENGATKKATVMVAFFVAYDLLAKTFLPVWLLPANMVFRYALEMIMVPQFIDWAVEKYNQNKWGDDGV